MGTTKVKIKEEAEKPKEKKPVKPVRVERQIDIRAITRVAGTDLNGDKPLIRAIRGIKGISYTFGKAICNASGFDPKRKLGSLDESELKKLEDIIKNPLNYGIPAWVLNRRRDRESGKDLHLSSFDLDIAKKFDIQREIDLKTYRGFRHMLGQPVRGQRTRGHFRTGREVGVVRKAVRTVMAKGGEEKKEEKK
jgi:small subunit ribosomal protein S13